MIDTHGRQDLVIQLAGLGVCSTNNQYSVDLTHVNAHVPGSYAKLLHPDVVSHCAAHSWTVDFVVAAPRGEGFFSWPKTPHMNPIEVGTSVYEQVVALVVVVVLVFLASSPRARPARANVRIVEKSILSKDTGCMTMCYGSRVVDRAWLKSRKFEALEARPCLCIFAPQNIAHE